MPQKVKILLIEDSEDYFLLFQRMLEKIEVGTTLLVREKTLADGLARLQGDIKFQVVFLDLTLPDSEGFDTFLRVHSAGNNVPIVILTANSDTSIIREALSCGAQDYLSKIGLSGDALERSVLHAIWRGSAEQNLQTKVRELELMQEKLRVMNQQLASSQNEYGELLNTIDGVVWEAEIGKSGYTFISNQVEKLLGYSTVRWLNDAGFWKSILHPEDAHSVTGPGHRAAAQKHDSQQEYRLIKANQEPIWIREYIKIIQEDGVATKMRGIMVDISNRKRAEEVLKRAESEAVRATNLKSDFLAHMSHEIRTPLNAIIGMSAMAMEGTLSSEQMECMSTIKTAGDALLMLVNDILDLSKIEAGMYQLEPLDFKLEDLLKQALDVVSLTARHKNLQIEYDLDPSLPEFVTGDIGAILRVLLNLVGNAVKFTPEAGRINISLQLAKREDERINHIRFEVKDSGLGISTEKQRKLFQPFSQVDASMSRKYGGTGLGLSISKHLVTLMKGSIGLESASGRGSTFYFEIPLATGRVPTSQVSPIDSPKSGKLSGMRILIAEDNVLNQKVIKRLLERLECAFDLAVNGRLAVEALQARPYDLILMDCQMPEMDGYEATQVIREMERRENRPRTPIVAVTAHAFNDDRLKCEKAGMDGYLSKPITLAQLENCIRQWMRNSQSPTGGIPMTDKKNAIDIRIINQLIEISGDSPKDFVTELIDLFQSSGETQMAKIHDAYQSMDLVTLEKEAHSFKSSCNNMGAIGLAVEMRKLETLAREGRHEILLAGREYFLKKNSEEFQKALSELEAIKIGRLTKAA